MPAYSAEQVPQPDGASVYIEAPMKRVGVDHQIAESNGYEIRIDANGIEYAIKKGAIAPLDEVSGTCGTSFVYWTSVDTSKHSATIYTGHTIYSSFPGAIYTDWAVGVIDSYGSSTKNWHDPSTPTHFWAKNHLFTSSGSGWAYADVLLGSIATLSNGTICFAGSPTASVYL
ncbi:hypothetical protein ACN27F_06660 [Solwaraspora sp. WMMB335]|uniref:hypothetical protein n=1 Tax=Solwaraspora sp. WMMB335 TaxID=3404118 RepID=UPI003B9653B1